MRPRVPLGAPGAPPARSFRRWPRVQDPVAQSAESRRGADGAALSPWRVDRGASSEAGGTGRESLPAGGQSSGRAAVLQLCSRAEAGRRARTPAPCGAHHPGAAGALRGERTALGAARGRSHLRLLRIPLWFTRCGFISSGRDGSRRGPQWRSRGNLENGQKKVSSLFHFRIFHGLRDLGCVFLAPGTEISDQVMMSLILNLTELAVALWEFTGQS